MRTVLLGVGIALIAAALRLPYGADIEYKADERFTFQAVERATLTGEVPLIGMPTSAGPANPGLSVWVFLGLSQIVPATDPPGLARGVELFSIAALFGLVLFIGRCVPVDEREAWYWAALLVAVNPMIVLYHRKIWPPSLFPLAAVLFLWGWWFRDRRWGAGLWAAVGTLMGQINAPAFFLTAAFAGWALAFDRRGVRWGAFALGAAVGILPMLPWFEAWWTGTLGEVTRGPKLYHLIDAGYYRKWFPQAFGFGLSHVFTPSEWRDFLSYPRVFRTPTYLVSVAFAALLLASMLTLISALRHWRNDPRPLAEKLIARHSPTAFTLAAAFLGYGLILALTCLPVHRHYLLALFVLPSVWVARMVLAAPLARPILMTLVIAQSFISASFLRYVHDHPRLHGEYGTPYSEQLRATYLAP